MFFVRTKKEMVFLGEKIVRTIFKKYLFVVHSTCRREIFRFSSTDS